MDILKLPESKRKVYNKYLEDLMFERSIIETKHIELEMAQHFARIDGVEEGRQQGLQQGLQQGAYEKSVTIAKKLKHKGLSLEDISDSTNLNLEQLAAIFKSE